jgi:uncharacterized caspase-like protein
VVIVPKTNRIAGKAAVACLPESGQVYAVVVGIETYRDRAGDTLQPVDFARNDAESFAAALRTIYPSESLNVIQLLDDQALRDDINYALKQSITQIGEHDLFIFYYAGHGFYGSGGNRITAWETHPHNIGETTLLLREVLSDRLSQSAGKHSLAFIDACASSFKEFGPGRDVISTLDREELREFLKPNTYSGVFLSCEPGQKSYPSNTHKHGVWTYFLLKALEGRAEDALSRERYLTDTSLRDYLRQVVPRFITSDTTFKGQQVPQAIITASNTFAIRQVPEVVVNVPPEGDLSEIKFAPEREFFEHVESRPISRLPGFNKKKGHFVPDYASDQVTKFIRASCAEQIHEEIQNIYGRIKTAFDLKRADISNHEGVGEGSLDTTTFRFSVYAQQNHSKFSEYVTVRTLELRESAAEHQQEIDAVFGATFDRIVVEGEGMRLDFDALVDLFENIEGAHGGKLEEDQRRGWVSYTGPDGTRVVLDVGRGRIQLKAEKRYRCSDLVARARRYRFGLTGSSRLLLGSA